MGSGKGKESNRDDYSIKQLRRKWLGSKWEDKMEEIIKKSWRRKMIHSTIYIYPRLLKNTCLRGHFKFLKIANHLVYGPLLFLLLPPETVSQTAMVIGSESFCTSTFKWILNLWGKHLWRLLRKVNLCVGAFLPSPQALLAAAASSCLAVIKGEMQIHQPFSPQHSQTDRRRKISVLGNVVQSI